jgi:hypothetical protein
MKPWLSKITSIKLAKKIAVSAVEPCQSVVKMISL